LHGLTIKRKVKLNMTENKFSTKAYLKRGLSRAEKFQFAGIVLTTLSLGGAFWAIENTRTTMKAQQVSKPGKNLTKSRTEPGWDTAKTMIFPTSRG